ncbi:MAG: DUF1015 domain-containing protein [Christensenellales bacterium]|jgi:hypothetical protein
MNEKLMKYGVSACRMLLPKERYLPRFAVVACDQYTSEPDYWRQVEALVGDAPSALHMVVPEIYLGQGDEKRIAATGAHMRRYMEEGVFRYLDEGVMLVERTLGDTGMIRRSVVLAVDLEAYDFHPEKKSPIRATEGTIEERIPPRLRVREHALLELSHIQVLIDDPQRRVVEGLFAHTPQLALQYDFELMQGGGRLRGWHVPEGEMLGELAGALEGVFAPGAYRARMGVDIETGAILFAVGDGNHSLATAKAHWEKLKATLPETELEGHPARLAMVELLNLHDDSLVFEPIHRVVFGIAPQALLKAMREAAERRGLAMKPDAPAGEGSHVIEAYFEGDERMLVFENPVDRLPVGTLQGILDEVLEAFPQAAIDYIHGGDVAKKLGQGSGAAAFLLPAMDKSALFPAVLHEGVLPRKTFSMGHAHEKRYYLEARLIVR